MVMGRNWDVLLAPGTFSNECTRPVITLRGYWVLSEVSSTLVISQAIAVLNRLEVKVGPIWTTRLVRLPPLLSFCEGRFSIGEW